MNQPLDRASGLLHDPTLLIRDRVHLEDRLGHEPQPPAVLEYWRAVMRWKWWIAAFVSIVVAATWWVVSAMPKSYRATTTLLIEASKAKVVSIDDVYAGASSNREYFQTQVEAIKSSEVAARVVRKLDLMHHPDFDVATPHPSLLRELILAYAPALAPAPTPPAPMTDAQAEETVLGRFMRGLSVEPVRLSQLVKIHYEASDPKLAARIANELAEAYIRSDIDARLKITQNAGSTLTDRLSELRARLDESERAVQAYREKQGLLDDKESATAGPTRQLAELTHRLVEARLRRADAEQQYREVRGGELVNYESVPAVMRNLSVQRARDQEADAERRLAEVLNAYGAEHPMRVTAETALKTARANTKRQIQTVVSSIAREFNSARAAEKSIEDDIARAKEAIQENSRKESQLGLLEREAATNRQLYNTFFQRARETSAAGELQQALARVIDPAKPPLAAARPAKLQLTSIAALASLLLAMSIAIAYRQLNNKINARDDVEVKLGQPVLAVLPVLHGSARRNSSAAMALKPDETFAEAIRTASTGITLSTIDSPRKVLAVASTLPGEGKSTFSTNLALWYAKTGKRTLLLEGDLRRPSLARVLGLGEAPRGLSDLVAGQVTLEDAAVVVSGSGLHVLTAGTAPPNALELIVSQAFTATLRKLVESYEIVIIDCPPLQLVSDALMLGMECTGMIYLVRANRTPVPSLRHGLRRVMSARIPLIGVVINGVDFRTAERYYGDYTGVEGKYGNYKTYAKPA